MIKYDFTNGTYTRMVYTDKDGIVRPLYGGIPVGKNHWYNPKNHNVYNITGLVLSLGSDADFVVNGDNTDFGSYSSNSSPDGNYTILCGKKIINGQPQMIALYNTKEDVT